MWDDNHELEEQWWQMINFFMLCGQNGIILEQDKFQFCVEVAQFAGFCITNKRRPIMATFKTLLIPKSEFIWNEELDLSFHKSKEITVDPNKEGAEIFGSNRLTYLRPDWSKIGTGFFLYQKHCACTQQFLGCCKNGWKITFIGSQFLRSKRHGMHQ